jgi:hypothetical protein
MQTREYSVAIAALLKVPQGIRRKENAPESGTSKKEPVAVSSAERGGTEATFAADRSGDESRQHFCE